MRIARSLEEMLLLLYSLIREGVMNVLKARNEYPLNQCAQHQYEKGVIKTTNSFK